MDNRFGSQDLAGDPRDIYEEKPRTRPSSYHPANTDHVDSQGHGRFRAPPEQMSPSSPQYPQPQSQAAPPGPYSTYSPPDTSAQIHPDLVAQITEQVIQSLKISGLGGNIQLPSQATPIPPAAASLRKTYTPPSPRRDEASNEGSFSSDFNDNHLDGSGEKETEQGSAHFAERHATPPLSTAREQSRPAAPTRVSIEDATTLEKIWQRLFDANGQPTPRLGQFLRGLAKHIIADFEPHQSLVITPQKMLKFYDTVKVPHEIYPWESIFGGKITNSSLSHLYRDLHCEHFFVQARIKDKPSIPALTPVGFECWMTNVIRAHPDTEYRRFADAVLNMPISNADDPKERFPKELTRRLFPGKADMDIQMELEDAILADPVIELRPETFAGSSQRSAPAAASSGRNNARTSASSARDPQMPQIPPLSSQPASQPASQYPPPPPPTVERDRTLYSTSTSESALEESGPSGISIERERKPYYSQPGGGKVYDGAEDGMARNEGIPTRSNSSAKPPRPNALDVPDDYNAPRTSRRYRSGSQTADTQPSHRRNSSINARATPYNKSDHAASTYSNAASSGAIQDSDDDGRRYSTSRQTYAVSDDGASKLYSTQSARSYDEERYSRRGSMQQGSSGYGGYPPPARYERRTD